MNIRAVETTQDRAAAERQQRVDLAACYRLVALYGWDDLVFTHISGRVPGPEHHFLINPYGIVDDNYLGRSTTTILAGP